MKSVGEDVSNSHDPIRENVARIQEAFPEAIADGRVNFDILRQELGEYVEEGEERYSFTWNGKARARRIAQTPSTGTLRPCPRESIDWDNSKNVFIEGENLEALKVLQKSCHRKIRLIFISPPYNTGKDKFFTSDGSTSLATYLQHTERVRTGESDLVVNSESSGSYHTNWLNMMYPRVKLARNLLRDDGYFVANIDDIEFRNLQYILDELFGEENRLAVLVTDRNRKNDARFFSVGHDYTLVYAKDKVKLTENGTRLRMAKEGVQELKELFERLRVEHKDDWQQVKAAIDAHLSTFSKDDPRRALARFSKVDKRGPYRTDGDVSWPGGGGPRYDVPHPVTGRPCKVPSRGWVWPSYLRMKEEIEKGKIVFGPDEETIPSRRRDLFEATEQVMQSVSFRYAQKTVQELARLFDGAKVVDNPKDPVEISQLIEYLTESGDTILDFFDRDGSTAHGVLLSNARQEGPQRRFICIHLPQPLGDSDKAASKSADYCTKMGIAPTSCSISRERIRRAGDSLVATSQLDRGFRCFTLSDSNIKPWDTDFGDLNEALLGGVENIREDRSQEDVLYELLLKYGLDLAMPVEERLIGNRKVFLVAGGALLVCLDGGINGDVAEGIARLKRELQPVVSRVVLRDSGFADDSVKTNVIQALKEAGVDEVRSL